MTLPDRLAHLPDRKRRELERVARILFDEFDDALTAQHVEEVLIGAQILHAVIDFDRQQFMGMGHQEAIAWMHGLCTCLLTGGDDFIGL